MAYDLDALPAEERTRLGRIGANFTTQEVQAQGGKTLSAFDSYKPEISASGFLAEDRQELAELLLEAEALPAERVSASEGRKQITATQHHNMKEGKKCRAQLHTILFALLNKMSRTKVDEPTRLSLEKTRSALATTSSAGADPELLATQLALLVECATLPELEAQATLRGAQPHITQAQALISALRDGVRQLGHRAANGGLIERGDVIEGLIVTLLRDARRAARAASRQLGRPEIADAFELDLLYNR